MTSYVNTEGVSLKLREMSGCTAILVLLIAAAGVASAESKYCSASYVAAMSITCSVIRTWFSHSSQSQVQMCKLSGEWHLS